MLFIFTYILIYAYGKYKAYIYIVANVYLFMFHICWYLYSCLYICHIYIHTEKLCISCIYGECIYIYIHMCVLYMLCIYIFFVLLVNRYMVHIYILCACCVTYLYICYIYIYIFKKIIHVCLCVYVLQKYI